MAEAKSKAKKSCSHEYMVTNWRSSSLNKAAFEVTCKYCLKVIKKPELDAIHKEQERNQ